MFGLQPVYRFGTVVGLALGLSLAGGRAQTPDLTLPLMPEELFPELREIIKTALQQSPEMLRKNIEVIVAEGSSLKETSFMWPNMASEASYGGSRASSADNTSSATSTQSGFYYNAWINQPVYQWGTLKARAEIGKIGLKLAEHNYADAAQGLINTIRSQYLGLITGKIALRNVRFALKQAEDSLAVEEARLKAGQVSPTDLMMPRMNVEERRLQRDRTEDGYERARRDFARLAGRGSFDDAQLPEAIPPPAYDPALVAALVSRFLHDGIEKTRQAQNYQLEIRKADLEYRIAKFGLYPRFSVGTNMSQQVNTSVNNGVVSQGAVLAQQVRVNANWTIFDGFWTRGAKLSSLAGKRLAERGYQTYLEGKAEQVRDSEKQLGFTKRELDIVEYRRLAMDGLLKRYQEDNTLGLVSRADVTARTLDYYQTEFNAFNSRAAYLVRWCEFVSLLGLDPALDVLPARFLSHAK